MMNTLYEMLPDLFAWVLRTSWQSSFLVLAVALTVFLLHRFLSPGARYIIWMLVVARLLLPMAISSPVSINAVPQHLVSRQLKQDVVQDVVLTVPELDRSIVSENLDVPVLPVQSATVLHRAEGSMAWLRHLVSGKSILFYFSLIWFATVVFLLVRLLYNHIRFSNRVIATRPVTDERIMVLLQDCKQQINVKVPLDVVETPCVKTPSLLGVVHPRLLLPEGLLSDFDTDQLRYFFLHELSHYKRGDLLVNWFLGLCHIVHWFNPVLLYAFSRIRLAREAACDAMVMALLTEQNENRRYGEAILHLLSHSSSNRWIPGAVGVLEDKKQLKERITMIAHYKPATFITSAFAGCAILILAATGLTAAENESPVGAGVVQVGDSEQVEGRSVSQVAASGTMQQPIASPEKSERIVVALNPLSFSRELTEDASFITDILLAELSQNAQLQVVDRDKLKNSLREMQLSEQGMINPAAAQQLGRILGASYFCSGSVSHRNDKLYIMAKIIDTETTLIKSAYASFEKGTDPVQAATELANQIAALTLVTDRENALARAEVETKEATPIPANWRRPTVMVIIPEMHVNQRIIFDPAGETEIVKNLLAAGFKVVDAASVEIDQRNDAPEDRNFLRRLFSYNINVNNGETSVRMGADDTQEDLANKLHTAAHYARKKGVDVLLYGEAISERGARLGQFEGCRGRIELKAISTADEQIILSDSAYGGATDLAESTAGKKAIQQAADKLSSTFIYDLCAKWNNQ